MPDSPGAKHQQRGKPAARRSSAEIKPPRERGGNKRKRQPDKCPARGGNGHEYQDAPSSPKKAKVS